MEIELRKYLRLIKRWWWLLVVGAVVPMVVSYYFASQQPALYQAKATIMVGTSVFQDPDPDPWQMNLSNTLAAAYAEFARQGPVTEAVIERLGLERTPEQLAAQVATGIRSGAQLLEIYVTDTNPEAAAVIANALADELIRRTPSSGGSDPEQQEFIRGQLEELQTKIQRIGEQIDELTISLSELTSAAEIQDVQDRIAGLEEVKSTYHATYANLLSSYRAESPNVLSLFEPAVVPQWPIPSKANLIVAVAGAAGLGLALAAIFLMDYLDTSLRWERDGAQSLLELPVLSAIPQVSKRDAVLASNPLSPIAEGVRAMRANIFLMRPDRPFKTLLVTSPSSSEGKSFILANLAVVLASAGNRVIAVDADMRRPALHEFFDQPNVAGLADVLSACEVDDEDEDSLSVLLRETGFENLYLLSAGRPPADPATLLTSPRLSNLLEFLRGQGDVILIDSPPVSGPPDATVLATIAEGTVLVVSAGLTKRELLQRAKDRLLAQQGVNLLGLAINRARLGGSYYHYSSDRGDGDSKWRKSGKDEAWITLAEAAGHLGVGKDVARRWCKNGRLPAVRKGLWWRVNREGLERMIEDTGAEPVQVREAWGENDEQGDQEALECTAEDSIVDPVQVREAWGESRDWVDREAFECTVEDAVAEPVEVKESREESRERMDQEELDHTGADLVRVEEPQEEDREPWEGARD
jgi:succinoglycan biosynthesis transport protein ExoP